MSNESYEETRVSWESGGHGRGTLDLLWSCIGTLVICTWTVQHLDVIWPRYRGRQEVTLRRAKHTIFALLMPEYMNGISIEQCCRAHVSVKKFKQLKGFEEWTITHGFFASMNGFRAICPNGDVIALRIEELYWLIQQDLIKAGMPTIRIKDEASSDHPSSNLEEGLIPREKSSEGPVLSQEQIFRCDKSDALAKAIACVQCGWFVLQIIARAVFDMEVSPLEIMTIAFTCLCFVTYVAWWKKPCNIDLSCTLEIAQDWKDWDVNMPSNRAQELERHKDGTGDLYLHAQTQFHSYITFALGACFGALHCVAWDLEYPSRAEQIGWRVCSLIITAWPLYMLFTTEPFVRRMVKVSKFFKILEHADSSQPLYWLHSSLAMAYALARLFLIIEAFISLRSLPRGVYETPRWTEYIPHI
ncbi:hypothetical protein HDK77DRAFT_456996 [Phyllosticta capitalensis]|uniref:Uncharacterized protein n=1 Tax=Phyllosticta capitalensis TaxID=121624 RepID=A0ABR1YPH5_9PEZI